MKKINLKNLSLDEVLSKDQLKKIVGGNGSGIDIIGNLYHCYCLDNGGIKVFQIHSQSDLDNVPLEMAYMCESYECSLWPR